MSKNIRFKNREQNASGDQLGLILPTFVLCLRDFSLVLEKDGVEISPDEYLEDSLQLKRGNDSSVEKFNRPRECIRKYFPKRKCFVFDRPGDRKVMKHLDTVPFEKLSESFVEETEVFLKYMYTCDAKVLISSKPVNGRMFVSLIDNYLTAISNGAVPDVDDAIMTVAKIENKIMADEAVEYFKQQIDQIELPVLHTKQFEQLYRDIQNVALTHFRNESMMHAEEFEKRAISEMNELWEKMKSDNMSQIHEYCQRNLDSIYIRSVGENIQRNVYKVPGGYQRYKVDIERMKKEYITLVDGIDTYEAQKVLMQLMEKESQNERFILMEDQQMTEEERKREQGQLEKEYKEAQIHQEELFKRKLEEEKARQDEHQRQLEQERTEYMRKQDERLQAIQLQWEEQRELSLKEIEMMRSELEVQRIQYREESRLQAEEYKRKEEENRQFFNEMLTEERQNAEQRMAKMEEHFKEMQDSEINRLGREYNQKMEMFTAQMQALALKDRQDEQRRQENEMREYKKEYKRRHQRIKRRRLKDFNRGYASGRLASLLSK